MHRFSDEEMTERASLYALGALSLWEARAFEEHLDEGCERCASELQSFEEVTCALGLVASEQEPPARVREKLLAFVAEEEESRMPSTPLRAVPPQPLITLRADEGEWHEIGKGVMVKRLFVDPQNGTVTSLFKMQPGTRIPLHNHRGIEQCYIVEGDFHADDQSLGAGDFHVALAGSTHKPVYTVGGALLLIVAPPDYDMIEHR